MNTVIHFIDVGQGNMVLIESSDGGFYLCDCNITNNNEDEVLDCLGDVFGWGENISAFICTHRDADHMRGIKKYINISLFNLYGVAVTREQLLILSNTENT